MKMMKTLRNRTHSVLMSWKLNIEGGDWEGILEGFPAILRRHPAGRHWMGWVQVPEYHKWAEKSLHTCTKWPQCVAEPVSPQIEKLAKGKHMWKCDHRLYKMLKGSVHGGVSHCGKLVDRPGWWIGFDCGHLGDMSPGIVNRLGQSRTNAIYRDKKFALAELAKLAKVIKNASANA